MDDIDYQKALLRGRREDQMMLLSPTMQNIMEKVMELRYLGLGAPQYPQGHNNVVGLPGGPQVPTPDPRAGMWGRTGELVNAARTDSDLLQTLSAFRRPNINTKPR